MFIGRCQGDDLFFYFIVKAIILKAYATKMKTFLLKIILNLNFGAENFYNSHTLQRLFAWAAFGSTLKTFSQTFYHAHLGHALIRSIIVIAVHTIWKQF